MNAASGDDEHQLASSSGATDLSALDIRGRALQAVELIAAKYIETIRAARGDGDPRRLMLDLRDLVIDEQAWLRRFGPSGTGSPDLEWLDAYRFTLARIEVVLNSAVLDESNAREAGKQISDALQHLLPIAVGLASADRSLLLRLGRVAEFLARDDY